jgi:hypothetical protein
MELFAKLFSSRLVFIYHCFDRIVIHGYLSELSRAEQSSTSSKQGARADGPQTPSWTTFELSATRYLRKMKAHGLIERDGKRMPID